ncbi:ADP-ribosylglycohydrolase family protein [Burkholderia stagnalis]|uniref:ADP-ribosylglycohydrolase family protein n=1 Tax=Burkholderia stagnalis TaxID=1503054 RepID=UPI00075A7EEE|nr:ADP-ribosylglycohydrolase family protein [Burkholderia stagnalis]KVM94327.1 ADP-ribosylglycohydrolase [Burkholderia stagnalis]KWE13384.1 ADP-ribosylglycohydrolase [Burkholderia stagnalis]KWE17055.1 ADP-ribosylglycohydrolase [Burkholderia stagnalis]KWH44335.1 ADP-ribosylglycohydrolase [Burkholderia stagnalis]KWH54958.1 ADP-ribosylglycohydrolase [Burkholderia stagnalis]
MSETVNQDQLDRAAGALLGCALGDAVGMPTQLLSPDGIRAIYGDVTGFVAPTADHPLSAGLPAATITDDTEQTLLLAETLLRSGAAFDHARWVDALIAWENDIRARGGYDLLGPSTKRALTAINAGVPVDEAGKAGDTNGAAMRIGPVGIATPLDPLMQLVERVADTCRATHNTNLAIASASAVAAAVSAGIEGADVHEATHVAIEAATLGEREGHWVAGASIAGRIRWAVDHVLRCDRQAAVEFITGLVGTSVAAQESVPAAFAVLAATGGNVWEACLMSANLGGDTDTIGAICGTIAGACQGRAKLPAAMVAEVCRVNALDVEPIARRLLTARHAFAARSRSGA